jgi:hypothetical protein
MGAIEPNWQALIGFCVLAALCCVAFLVLVGMFPSASRPSGLKSVAGAGLIGVNIALLIALAGLTGAFGYGQLRVTSLIVFGGLAVLFAPGAFEAWPTHWRDSLAGLGLLMAGQVIGIGTLIGAAGI